MPVYDVELELHDRSVNPPKVLWSGTIQVTTETKAKAYAKAQLELWQHPPVPKIEHLYTQVISAIEVVTTPEEALL